jgi:DegV family protein with EDD domain
MGQKEGLPVKNFQISVDSSACFTDEALNEYGFFMVHLSYTLDGREYIDAFDNDDQKQALYDQLSAGHMAQSSKANPEAFRKVWETPLREGANILHLSLSSKVSGSYESACLAAREMNEQYGGRVEVVDTGTGSFAVTALAMELAKLQHTATVDDAKRIAQESLKEYNLIFTVGDIKYLRRGGRISHIKALLGGLLHLKPVLFINGEGRITFFANARGMRQALELMVEKMKRSATEKTDSAYIAHGGDAALAKRLQEKIEEEFPVIKRITSDFLTPVLGLHAGPGALVLCFRGAERDHIIDDRPLKELRERLHLTKS